MSYFRRVLDGFGKKIPALVRHHYQRRDYIGLAKNLEFELGRILLPHSEAKRCALYVVVLLGAPLSAFSAISDFEDREIETAGESSDARE